MAVLWAELQHQEYLQATQYYNIHFIRELGIQVIHLQKKSPHPLVRGQLHMDIADGINPTEGR